MFKYYKRLDDVLMFEKQFLPGKKQPAAMFYLKHCCWLNNKNGYPNFV
jgi:hypothetical protein